MEGFPLALALASQEEVFHNNNVLYRLVRSLPDGSGVQSTDKLVNVVPFRRVYTFYRKQEIIDFEQLLLARPLVLQPVLHFGRGLGSCGACYNDEPWVVMLNQTHPKILGRLQMGMDLAKQAIEKGQSVELKFCLTQLIQRIYQEHLKQKETGDAKGLRHQILSFTRFTEWEHADLIIRYHGYEAKTWNKRDRKHHKTFHKEWHFDDIGSHEIDWNQTSADQIFPLPHNAPVSEEELRAVLPAWTFNEVSPLQGIGDNVPLQNYSYAQAGRLYESFRKKKRQHPQSAGHSFPERQLDVDINASAYCAVKDQQSPVAIEHDFSSEVDRQDKSLSRARRAYMDHENSYYGDHQNGQMSPHVDYPEEEYNPTNSSDYYGPSASNVSSRHNNIYADEQVSSQREVQQSSSSNDEHIDVNVLVQPSPVSNRKSAPHYNRSHLPSHHYLNNVVLKKQDSDRSHGSTNADSGFGDDQRSRGGSYDYNDPSRIEQKSKQGIQTFDRISPYADEGLVNPAFNYEDTQEDALHRHKDFVARMKDKGRGKNMGAIPKTYHNGRMGKEQSYNNNFSEKLEEVSHGGTKNPDVVAESFI